MGSAWSAEPHAIRIIALSLRFSAEEYARTVWCHSTHTKKLYIVINETFRVITGYLKNIAIEKL